MRKTMSLFLALVMLLSVCSFASAEETEYTVKTVPVFRGTEQAGSMDLRYYSDAPNVACYGMKAYLNLLRGEELTVTAEDGGLWTVTAPNDTSIQVNPAAGTITAADWARFQSPLTPYDKMVGIKDSPCAWSYYTDLTFTDEPAAVIFNLAKYSIPLHADREDVYMPLALLATMFTDVATNRVIFNGEKAFLSVLDVNAIGVLPDGFYDPMKALISGEEQRSEDVIRVSYGELCFVLDYFFGHPGTGAWDESIREIGLDETLKAKGPEIREALLSPVYLQHVIAGSRDEDRHGSRGGHQHLVPKPGGNDEFPAANPGCGLGKRGLPRMRQYRHSSDRCLRSRRQGLGSLLRRYGRNSHGRVWYHRNRPEKGFGEPRDQKCPLRSFLQHRRQLPIS